MMAISLLSQIATIWMALHPVLFSRYLHRHNGDLRTSGFADAKFDVTFNYRIDRVVAAHADIGAGMPFRAALAQNDIAGDDFFAAEFLYAKAAACTVTTIA
jgi:hypothetical protein